MRLAVLTFLLVLCIATTKTSKKSFGRGVGHLSFRMEYLMSLENQTDYMFSPMALHAMFTMVYKHTFNDCKILGPLASRYPYIVDSHKFYRKYFKSTINTATEAIADLHTSLWVRSNVSLSPEYKDRLEDNYKSNVYTLDWSNPPDTIKRINSWLNATMRGVYTPVDEWDFKTKGDVYLMSTAYFQPKIQMVYSDFTTKDFTNFGDPENVVSVLMMTFIGEVDYYEDQHFKAVKLPLSGSQYQLLIILPNGLEMYEERFFEIAKKVRYNVHDMRVYVPKFKLVSNHKTQDIRSNLRSVLMSPKCYLHYATNNGSLKISEIFHQTIFIMDDHCLDIAHEFCRRFTTTCDNPNSYEFVIDQPFHFYVLDRMTILYSGKVSQIEQ